MLIVPLVLIANGQDDAEQTPQPTLQITGINSANLPEAKLTVNVMDTFGQYVPNLTVEDFNLSNQLSQYGRIVQVENVTDDDLPISVVLVIDTSSSMSGSPITRARQAAIQFVDLLGEQDHVAIITFDSNITTVQEFTTDKALLRQAIETFPIGGQTALYDGTATGLIYGLTAPTERRTVVLLSDGAEYGGTGEDGTIYPASDVSRSETLRTTAMSDVSFYTIGLGFGADRTYLQDVSASTNGQFYESPTPDSLTEIYSQIAHVLRTQYILTLDAELPLDGAEYDFSLQARTPYGLTNIDSARLRAPIPAPIIQMPELHPEPLTERVELPVRIVADDYPLDVEYIILQSPRGGVIDDAPLDFVAPTFRNAGVLDADGDYQIIIDPRRLDMGAYQTQLNVTDADGDQTNMMINFEVGSIPSEFTVDGLPENNQLSGIFLPNETLQLRVTMDYLQSSVTRVIYEKDGVVLGESTTVPYAIDLPILDTFGGQNQHNLTVTVETRERQDVLTIPFTAMVSPPPTLTPTFTPTPTATMTPTPTPTLDIPATVQAHSGSINSALGNLRFHSATEVAYVQATQVQATLQTELTVDAQARFDARATANAEATLISQATADAQATLNAQATFSAEQTFVFEATLSAELESTATHQANVQATEVSIAQATADTMNTADAQLLVDTIATLDAQGTATAHAMLSTAQAMQTQSAERILQVTADAQATIDTVDAFFAEQTAAFQMTQEAETTLSAQSTTDAVLTLEAESTVALLTVEAQALVDTQSTADAVLTLDAESTVVGLTLEAQATGDVESTAIGATLAAQATNDSQATQTAEAITATPTATITPEFTNTPVRLIEVEAPNAGTDFLTQVQPYLPFVCGGGLVVFLLLLFLFKRNKPTAS